MASLIAHNEPAPLEGLEACDQTHFGLFSPDLIPGEPNAIGDTNLRHAFVLYELLRRKHVAAGRSMIGRNAAVFDKGVDHELTFDADRIGSLAIVKEEPAAKAPFSSDFRIMADRFGPGPHNSIRRPFARLLLPFPRQGDIFHRGEFLTGRRLATGRLNRDGDRESAQASVGVQLTHCHACQTERIAWERQPCFTSTRESPIVANSWPHRAPRKMLARSRRDWRFPCRR